MQLSLPSFTLTPAWNFLPAGSLLFFFSSFFLHHLSTLVSYTCHNSPLKTLRRIRFAEMCEADPDTIKAACLVGSGEGMRSFYSSPSSACKRCFTLLQCKNRSKNQHFPKLVSFFLSPSPPPPPAKVLLSLAIS